MVRTCPWYCVLLAAVDHSDRVCLNSVTHHFLASSSRLSFVSLYFPLFLKWYSHSFNAISVLFQFHRGYTGAGGLEKNGLYRNCTGGAARLVDVSLFGNDHIYQRPTPRAIYDTTLAFDPEGLRFFHSLHFCPIPLTCHEMTKKVCFWTCLWLYTLFLSVLLSGALGGLTCVLCAYLGAEAAKVLLVFPANKQRIIRWMLWALATVSSKIGYSRDGFLVPRLYSIRFVLSKRDYQEGSFVTSRSMTDPSRSTRTCGLCRMCWSRVP